MNYNRKVYIALPALKEFKNLDSFLNCVHKQTFRDFELVVCVNQPELWWQNPEKRAACLDNEKSIAYLQKEHGLKITIIDKSSQGNGWTEKKKGVGIARKTLFDFICAEAAPTDLVVSLDADTSFGENYFESLVKQFDAYPKALALSLPYRHPFTDYEAQNRASLRYEIYMRSYLLNLFRIGSPYAFTALGSGIVFPVSTYKKIRSIAPLEAGEDFYFLETLCKMGKVLLVNDETIYPSARVSDRVPFGTGLAIQKGISHDWKSYPIYAPELFDNIRETYQLFPTLFKEDIETPLSAFLQMQLKEKDLWSSLRKNFKIETLFVKACHQRLDGLRILQYLKQSQPSINATDEENIYSLCKNIFTPTEMKDMQIHFQELSFSQTCINELDKLRNVLENKENQFRQQIIVTGL